MMTVSIKVSVHVDHKHIMGRQVISRKNSVEPILKKLTRESPEHDPKHRTGAYTTLQLVQAAFQNYQT